MTAQTPERIVIDGRPHALRSEPLYRLLASRRIDFQSEERGYSTACWRGYTGTWEICDGTLYLLHLNLNIGDEIPMPEKDRDKLFRAVPARHFPVAAHWFNGVLRISCGRRLVYSHHGWSSIFERERVITLRQGKVKRDRLVNTKAMLERALQRKSCRLDDEDETHPPGFGPMVWFDESGDDEDWTSDWWPPDYVHPGLAASAKQTQP